MVIPTGATISDTPVGVIHLVANERGLTHVLFSGEQRLPTGGHSPAAQKILQAAALQLKEYFEGHRKVFDVPLDLSGTDFQMAVWTTLQEIRFGETTSYGEIAQRISRPKAVRAVGAANGANPISIIVPCHRIVGADGRLTGYGGGLPAKKHLLALEGIQLVGDRVVSQGGCREIYSARKTVMGSTREALRAGR